MMPLLQTAYGAGVVPRLPDPSLFWFLDVLCVHADLKWDLMEYICTDARQIGMHALLLENSDNAHAQLMFSDDRNMLFEKLPVSSQTGCDLGLYRKILKT
jgi:hypothetical protein